MGKMMRFWVAALLAGLVWVSGAQAALDLELTQGVRSALPIAIVPFAHEQNTLAPGKQTVTQIMAHDLSNSGQFRIVAPKGAQTPAIPSAINFAYWRKKGANDIVIGSVRDIGLGRYQVSMQLLSLYNTAANAKTFNPANATLIDQSFVVRREGLRVLAHHLSDLIYQKLTGVPGIFNTKIAYILINRNPLKPQQATYRLDVSDIDGFQPETLLKQSAPIMSPTWSPNGKELAYVSFAGQHMAIYLQNIYTGKRRIVSQFPGINGAPAFSPNGKKMALVLTRTGNPKIYVMNLASGKLTQITHGYSIDTEPAWSDNGKALLFTSSRGGSPQIYSYTFATKKIQRLTFSGNYNARASFSPNEQAIVFMHRGAGMFSIARQNLQTGRVTELTRAANAESPSLAPNGKMVVYATNYSGRGVLAMVSIDGKIRLRLPAQNGSVQEPAWSPFIKV